MHMKMTSFPSDVNRPPHSFFKNNFCSLAGSEKQAKPKPINTTRKDTLVGDQYCSYQRKAQS